jgi:hypothetical protein
VLDQVAVAVVLEAGADRTRRHELAKRRHLAFRLRPCRGITGGRYLQLAQGAVVRARCIAMLHDATGSVAVNSFLGWAISF